MIICSKHEGNGTYREFVLDDAEQGDEVAVKTHIAHRSGEDAADDDGWTEAGVIVRAPDGLKAAVRARFGKPGFKKLDDVFSNEIAALQAIAVNYEPAPLQN